MQYTFREGIPFPRTEDHNLEENVYKNAAIYIEKAVKAGKNETLLDHLGDIYEAMDDIVKALNAWNEALKMNPDNESIQRKVNKYK